MTNESERDNGRPITRRGYLLATVSALTLAGCASETNEDQSPTERVNAWLDDHEDSEREAVEQYTDGNNAYDSESYSRALMHFERASEGYESLETAAGDKAGEYENGSRTWELFSMLTQYYAFMRRAATFRYSAAYERSVNDDPVASEEALATSDERFERAEELKQEFREMMDD